MPAKERPEGLLTFEQFLEAVYPPPRQDDDLYTFYEQWGYEQYLIRTQKYDIEQLRIIHANAFALTRLASIGESGPEIAEWAREHRRPLVVAERDWTGFVWRKVVKGLVGVVMWIEDNGDLFCIFPKLGTSPLTEQYIGPVNPEWVRSTNMVFESDDQVIELSLANI